MFSVQLYETFGIANLSQLMACIWYVGKNAVEEDFIFLQTIPEANNRSWHHADDIWILWKKELD